MISFIDSRCSSSAVKQLLTAAHCKRRIDFRVIVVDSRPLNDGQRLANELADHGLNVTLVHLSALSYVMYEASKVLIGAHALLSNGTLMSRVGTAMVCTLAHDMGVPVIVCCETYKFSDRVQLDSFVNNELGDPENLIDVGGYLPLMDTVLSFDNTLGTSEGTSAASLLSLTDKQRQSSTNSLAQATNVQEVDQSSLALWKEIPELKLLNLMYDVTPGEFITVVITEIGLIPCSSAPAIMRMWNQPQQVRQ